MMNRVSSPWTGHNDYKNNSIENIYKLNMSSNRGLYCIWLKFQGIYRGLPVVSAGSVPGSAVFFTIYESIRRKKLQNETLQTMKNNILAPSCGELGACLVRVPVEVIKQSNWIIAKTIQCWSAFQITFMNAQFQSFSNINIQVSWWTINLVSNN